MTWLYIYICINTLIHTSLIYIYIYVQACIYIYITNCSMYIILAYIWLIYGKHVRVFLYLCYISRLRIQDLLVVHDWAWGRSLGWVKRRGPHSSVQNLCWWYIGDIMIQNLCSGFYYPIYWGLFHKPIEVSLWTNQYNGMREGFWTLLKWPSCT